MNHFLMPDMILAVSLSSDGRYLGAVTNLGATRIFDVAQGKQLIRLVSTGGLGGQIMFSPDGREFFVDEKDGLSKFHTESGKLALTFKDARGPFALSADGQYLAALTSRDSITLFDAHTAKKGLQASGIDFGPKIAFSPDSHYLAIGSSHLEQDISEIIVFDISKQNEVASLRSRGSIHALLFSRDGRVLSTATELKDNHVLITRQWLFPKDLLADICSRITRNLSREEWQQFATGFYEKTCPNLPKSSELKPSSLIAEPETPVQANLNEEPAVTAPNLQAPTLVSPADRAVFNDSSRDTTLRWNAVPGASSYIVQMDWCETTDAWINSGEIWCEDGNSIGGIIKGIATTEYSFDFPGASPGRWRVWAVDSSGHVGSSSPFRTLRYSQ
jgi:dipeptidyl aminopeptidase/acylaminoacyl peptidase